MTNSPSIGNTARTTPLLIRPPGFSFWIARQFDARRDAGKVGMDGWGDDLVLNTKTTPLPQDASVLDLAATGELLLTQAHSAVDQDTLKLAPAKISLWTKDHGARLLDDARGRRPTRQLIFGQLRGSDVVWSETTSTNLFEQDWQIRTVDSRGGQSRLIADSTTLYPGVKHLRPATSDTIPMISNDRTVYWAVAQPDPKAIQGHTAVVLARDLAARGPIRTIADHASEPQIAGNTLYYVRADDVSPETPQKVLEIVAVAPGGRRRRVVKAPLIGEQQVLAFAATATHLAWVIGNTDRQAEPPTKPGEGCGGFADYACSVFVLDQRTNTATRIMLHSSGATLDLDAGLLGFAGSTGQGDAAQYIFELDSNRLWNVGESPACGQVSITEPYASWYLESSEGADTGCPGQVVVHWRTPR